MMRFNASDLTYLKASTALAPRGPNFVDNSASPSHRGTARHAGKPPRRAFFTYVDPSASLLWISSLCGIILSTILSAVMISRGQPSAGYMLCLGIAVAGLRVASDWANSPAGQVKISARTSRALRCRKHRCTPKSRRRWRPGARTPA